MRAAYRKESGHLIRRRLPLLVGASLLTCLGAMLIFSCGGGNDSNPVANNGPTKPLTDGPVFSGATDVPVQTVLRWKCSDPENDALLYDVYFGTAETPPKVASNQSGSEFNPGTLVTGTHYHWRVVARDSHGNQSSSDIFGFTTVGFVGAFACTAGVTRTSGLIPLSVTFSGSASGGTAPYTYAWAFGDGQTSATQNPNHVYNTAGTFTVELTVTDSTAATCTKSLQIFASQSFDCAASTTKPEGTAPFTTTFLGSAQGGTSPYHYSWDFGDGAPVSSDPNPSHTYASAGVYQAVLSITDSLGAACSKRVTCTVYEALACAASASKTSGPVPLTVSLTGTASGGSTPYQFLWQFNDGTPPSSLQNPEHIFSASGTFNVLLTVTDSLANSCTSNISIAAGVPLICRATANAESGAVPLTVIFGGSASGGTSPYSYSWVFGDGQSTAAQNPSHTYVSVGTYTVVLTATDNAGATALSTLTITVTNRPLSCSPTIEPTIGTAPLVVNFTANASGGSGSYTYRWVFGDGTLGSTGATATHTYQTQGIYNGSLTVTDRLGGASVVKRFTVGVAGSSYSCTATATPQTGRIPLTVSFSGSATGGLGPYYFGWDFGDGDTVLNVKQPTHIFREPGTYTVVMGVADQRSNFCVKKLTITALDYDALTCSISASPASGLAPLNVSFTANYTGGESPYRFSWDFGDGTTSTQQSPSHQYLAPGSYTARFSVMDNDRRICSKTVLITVAAPPALNCFIQNFGQSSGLAPFTVNFIGNALGGTTPYTFSWVFGDGATSTAQNPTHIFSTPGTYAVSMAVTDGAQNTCTHSVNITVAERLPRKIRIINDLASTGDWKDYNTIITLRIGPTLASISEANTYTERLTKYTYVSLDGEWKDIPPLYRQNQASNSMEFDADSLGLGQGYFLYFQTGWWRVCEDIGSYCVYKYWTNVTCCDCQNTCYKGSSVEWRGHVNDTAKIYLSQFLPDFMWCTNGQKAPQCNSPSQPGGIDTPGLTETNRTQIIDQAGYGTPIDIQIDQ